MANLETLELTIRSNAEAAASGVNSFASALSRLRSQANSAFRSLKKLNDELARSTGASGSTGVTAATAASSAATAATSTTTRATSRAVEAASEATSRAVGAATEGMQRMGHVAHHTASRIGRIFTTMLIRTAIRSMIKMFGEAWNAAYAFSSSMGGDFARNVDQAKIALSSVATNLVTAFAPALSAIVPVINTVAAAVRYLCDLINQLVSLLGGASEFFGVATDAVNKYAGAAGGGGKANKDLLASFDELNVIQSQSGGGGGGGSSSLVSGVVNEELANVSFAISEALLAVGLIMACFGHPAIGVGLMAIGAAGMAKTLINDWGGLSSEVKAEIETIMGIVGVSALALGAILAFSGASIPLGIGLMLIGAANLAGVSYINWNDTISPEVKETLTKLTAGVGGAMLALGAIFLFSGAAPALGIGLLIAGGLSLATAVGLNWNSIVDNVIDIGMTISTWLVNAWDSVATAVSLAWDVVSQWWTGIWSSISTAWGIAIEWLSGIWDDLKETIYLAWCVVRNWWTDILSNISLAWSMVASWLDLNVWQPIKRFFTNAWNAITEFWNDPLGCIIRAWEGVEEWIINNVWQPIKEFFVNTWESIKEFWKDPLGAIKTAWQFVSRWFDEYVWSPIKGFFEDAWNKIKEFWADPLGVIKRAWDGIASWINQNVWEPIGNFVSNIWNSIKQWWDTNIKSKFEEAWGSVDEAFKPLRDILNEIWQLMQGIAGFGGINVTSGTSNAILNAALNNGNTSNNGGSGTSIFKTLTTNAKKILGYASGGFPIQGDLFVANESGAELVGSINGRTSVANQQEIIDGIARGVESANQDQNTLLREQNTLLRQILQKDNSVRLSASAQLGRVTRQSLDMYGSMVGG